MMSFNKRFVPFMEKDTHTGEFRSVPTGIIAVEKIEVMWRNGENYILKQEGYGEIAVRADIMKPFINLLE